MERKQTITLVIRAPEGASLGDISPFLQPGAHIAVGRGLAVVEAVVEPIPPHLQLESAALPAREA